MLGCGGEEADLGPWRLVEQDPTQELELANLMEDEEVFLWSFKTEDDLAQWQTNAGPEGWEATPLGAQWSVSRPFLTVRREETFAADSIDSLEIVTQGLAPRPFVLNWAGPGERFSEERQVEGALVDSAQGVLRARLRGHPLWRGEIARVRLGLRVPRGGLPLIEAVRGLRESLREGALEEVLLGSYKVNLGNDLRNARPSVPGVPLELEVEVPAGARLSFASGLLGRPGAVALQVRGFLSGEESEVLFEQTLESPAAWHDVTVDLEPYAGSRLRLEFDSRLTTGEAFDPSRGLVLWAHPEVRVPPREADPPNVILISLDTLRPDHLSLYGYERPTSPHIDAWAESRGVTFEKAVAAAPWTLPSHVSMFTGLSAHRHGVNYQDAAPARLDTLAELLHTAGYFTVAVTGSGYLHPRFGFAQGFERFDFGEANMGMDAELEESLGTVEEWLEQPVAEPFFLFFHTYEIHGPYRPRQPYFRQLTGREESPNLYMTVEDLPFEPGEVFRRGQRLSYLQGREVLEEQPEDPIRQALDRYDSGIAYTDAAIGRLFERLRRLDLERRTLVVLTSDHGEMFGEHGLLSHASLYDENLLVPLVIALPGGEEGGRRVPYQVRGVDLTPTVLDLVGVPVPEGLDGTSLGPLLEGASPPPSAQVAWSYAPLSNFGLGLRVGDRWKYLFRNSALEETRPVESLVDLETNPGEESLPSQDTERMAEFRRQVQAALEHEVVGPRLRIVNQEGRGPLVGELVGEDWLPRLKVSRVELAGSVEVVNGRARFEAMPGETVEYRLETSITQFLKLRLWGEGLEELTAEVDLARLEGIWRARPGSEGWQVEPRGAMEGDGIYLWWPERPAEVDSADVVVDGELLERLEALGYVQ